MRDARVTVKLLAATACGRPDTEAAGNRELNCRNRLCVLLLSRRVLNGKMPIRSNRLRMYGFCRRVLSRSCLASYSVAMAVYLLCKTQPGRFSLSRLHMSLCSMPQHPPMPSHDGIGNQSHRRRQSHLTPQFCKVCC